MKSGVASETYTVNTADVAVSSSSEYPVRVTVPFHTFASYVLHFAVILYKEVSINTFA